MSYDPIKVAANRNEAARRERAARVPEVGIWWIIDRKLVADSIPYTEAPEHAGFREGKNDHYAFFATLQRIMPKLRHAEYTDFPRGRVIYDANNGRFLCYGSKKFAASTAQKRRILNEFRLPTNATKFVPDLHYEDPAA